MKISIINEAGVLDYLGKLKYQFGKNPRLGRGIYPRDIEQGERQVVDPNQVKQFNKEDLWQEANRLQEKSLELLKTNPQSAYEMLAKSAQVFKKLSDINQVTGLRADPGRYEKDQTLHVIIDIDNLKLMNSLLGHHGANAVLNDFAGVLNDNLEDQEIRSKAFHPHGDEFGAMVNLDVPEDEKKAIILKVHQRCKNIGRQFSSKLYKIANDDTMIPTVTIGIGFNKEETDIAVDNAKMERRRIHLTRRDNVHLLVMPDVKKYL